MTEEMEMAERQEAAGVSAADRSEPEMRKGAKKKLAEDVSRIIEENYKEKFSLEGIAEKVYHNKSYLDRTFHEVTGHTPLEYHNYVRCRKSRDLLECSSLSISYISDEVGFASPAHYSRIFKKIYRCSPMQYRKMYAERGGEDRAEKKDA